MSKVRVTVEKRNGTGLCAGGRERPHPTFGRLGRKKVGSSRPFQSFFHGDLSLHFVPYLLRVQEIARATG
jgi:hypothetical protein